MSNLLYASAQTYHFKVILHTVMQLPSQNVSKFNLLSWCSCPDLGRNRIHCAVSWIGSPRQVGLNGCTMEARGKNKQDDAQTICTAGPLWAKKDRAFTVCGFEDLEMHYTSVERGLRSFNWQMIFVLICVTDQPPNWDPRHSDLTAELRPQQPDWVTDITSYDQKSSRATCTCGDLPTTPSTESGAGRLWR